MDVLVGTDMGTGSTNGVLVDAAGTFLASETLAHSKDLPRPRWAEADETPAQDSYTPEQAVTISAPPERVYLFDADSGERLP